MSSSYRLTLENWLKSLDVKADTLLDIGGSQLQLPSRVKTWDVKEYLIADLANPHNDSQKPDIILDLNRPYNSNETYNTIFCLEVFEYIYDPMQAMSTISMLLTKNGSAWVTFPSFYPLHQPIADDALRYMPTGIRKLAEKVELEIKQMIPRRPETSSLQAFFGAERLRAAKGEDHNWLGWIVEFSK